MKRIIAIVCLLALTMSLCACGHKASNLKVRKFVERCNDEDSEYDKLRLKKDGSGVYVDNNYNPAAIGASSKIRIEANGDDYIERVVLELDKGTVEGMEKFGDTSFGDMVVGDDDAPDVPLKESKGDPRTGAYFASWTYCKVFGNLFDSSKMSDKVYNTSYEDWVDGVTIGKWYLVAKDGDDGLVVTAEAK